MSKKREKKENVLKKKKESIHMPSLYFRRHNNQKRYMLYPYSLYQLLPLAASIVFDSNMIDSKSQLASTYGVGNYKYTTLYQAIPAAFIYSF
jgi:hypothetical protein